MPGQKKRRDRSIPTVQTPPAGARPLERRRVHRRPRLVPFLVTGAVLGAIAGVILRLTADEPTLYGANQEMLILVGAGAIAGLFLSAALFVLVDLIDARR